MTRRSALITVLLLAGFWTAPGLYAQALPQLGSTFFSVSITRNDTPLLKASIFKGTDDHLIIKGSALAAVVARAYGVPQHQVVDGPDWIYETHLFDIEAVPPPLFVEANESQMLRNMLADNFGLELHAQMRELEMLVLARDETATLPEPSAGEQFMVPLARYRWVRGEPATMIGRGTMGMLAARLSEVLRQPVLDMTGVEGVYDLELEAVLEAADSYRNPLRENLGLKLERRAVPMEVLVVDRIRRPGLDL